MSRMTPLEALRSAAHLPLGMWQAQYPGFRAMGVLCSYVPAEILHAAGFTPVRLRGTSSQLRRADSHLPSYTCALCRGALDQMLAGDLDLLAGAAFAHTCDTMQALADLWRVCSGAPQCVVTAMLPASLDGPSSRAYLVAELVRFRQRLEELGGRSIRDEDLLASIDLYDETRRLVLHLTSLRQRLAAGDFYAILDAAQTMPRSLFNPLLSSLLQELATAPVRAGGPRLFLAGAVLDDPGLTTMIEELGGQVVGDDLCSGSRHFFGQVGRSGDPIASLADYSLGRPPCPSKLNRSLDPARALLEQVRATSADGLVFFLEKSCEPHAFQVALLRPALEQAGIPCLHLEMEQTPNTEGLRTRLQAFLETL